MNKTDFLWFEKYRPTTIAECVLTDSLKSTFQQFVDQKNIPNLLLVGSSGVGKTTAARAMVSQIGAESMIINGSLNAGIDVLRNDIAQFASSVSFMTDGRKYVILDEADFLNPNSVQPALRNFMEEFSSNCGFILTANFQSKILDALKSRCSVIDFTIPKAERNKMAVQLLKRLAIMLKKEGVPFDQDALAAMVKKWFPDARRIINELQRYASQGNGIDHGIVSNFHEVSVAMLLGFLREKDFTNARKWAAENADLNPQEVFNKLFAGLDQHLKKESIPDIILTLNDYQDKATRVANQEINMAALFAELMIKSEWK